MGLILLLVACACKIDKFQVDQEPHGYTIERDYFLSPMKFSSLDKSPYAYDRSVNNLSVGYKTPYLHMRLLATDRHELQLLVHPDVDPAKWTYDIMWDNRAGSLPEWSYDADFFSTDLVGLVFSNQRMFLAKPDRDEFLDLYPDYNISSVSAVETAFGPDPVFLSPSGNPINHNATLLRYSLENRRWQAPLPLSCSYFISTNVSLRDYVLFGCGDHIAIYRGSTNSIEYLQLPGLGTAKVIAEYQMTPSPQKDEALISAWVQAGKGQPVTNWHYRFKNGVLSHVTNWDGLEINNVVWFTDGSLIVATNNTVGIASDIGKALEAKLNNSKCLLFLVADSSYTYAFCGGGIKGKLLLKDEMRSFSQPMAGASFSRIMLSGDFGRSWRDVSSLLGF